MTDPPTITIKEERAAKWLAQGAQPSDPVARILDKNGIFARTSLSGNRAGSVVASQPAGDEPSKEPADDSPDETNEE
jgi:hypothetical protein